MLMTLQPLPTSPLLGSDRPPFLSGLGIDLPTPTQPRFLSRAHKKSQVAHNVFPETYPDHERSRESTPTSSSSGDATSRNSIEQLSSVTQIEPSQPEYLDTQASAAKSSQEVSVIKPTTSEEPSHGSEPKSNDATFADDSSSVYSDHTAEPVDEHEDEPDLADDPDDHKPGLEDFDPAIIPAPLQINKLRNRGQLQVSRTEEGKINRKGSFMEKLNAEKRHREELIRSKSHPALRTAALEQESEERWMISERQRSQTPTIPKLVRIDSGIGMPPTKLPPLPGSVTAPLPQTNFLSTTPVKSSVSPSIERAFEALLRGLNRTPTKHEADCARLQKNAFMQMFRTDLGLAQLRPAGRNEPKHSNHPFQFDAENIMCNDKHNPPPPTSPAAVRAPLGTPTTVSMPAMPTTANVPSQILAAAKKCARCKRHCCLFTTLLQISQGRGGRELREQAVRNQALQRVNKLKQSFPNGIEPYDTFVTCGTCSLEVCPVCAKICDEQLCGHVICKACVCSAHEEC